MIDTIAIDAQSADELAIDRPTDATDLVECPNCPGTLHHAPSGYMECATCGHVDDDDDWDEQGWESDRDYEVGR